MSPEPSMFKVPPRTGVPALLVLDPLPALPPPLDPLLHAAVASSTTPLTATSRSRRGERMIMWFLLALGSVEDGSRRRDRAAGRCLRPPDSHAGQELGNGAGP